VIQFGLFEFGIGKWVTCTNNNKNNNNNNNNNFGTGSRDGKKSFKLELCFCCWEREMLWVRRGWEWWGVAKGKLWSE
jgi:hypothetical protein